MAAVIGKSVQHRETGFVPRDDMVGDVIIRLGHPGKKRVLRQSRFRGQNVLDSPRGMESFHPQRLGGCPQKVKTCDAEYRLVQRSVMTPAAIVEQPSRLDSRDALSH